MNDRSHDIKKLRLPGFTEPRKVCLLCFVAYIFIFVTIIQHHTTKGIPFYINLPSNILKRCLSMPDIARFISRFPVKPTRELRLVLT